MEDDGKVHISGYIEPHVLLKCIQKNGKNAHLVHWQYGECETNLYRNGYGGGYSNGNGYNNHYSNHQQGGYRGYNNYVHSYNYNPQSHTTYVPSYPPRGDPYDNHDGSSSCCIALDNAANKEEPVRRGLEAGAPGSTLRRSVAKNFTIKVDVGNNWIKTVEKVLNSVKGVTSFRMEDDGKVHISGYIEPHVLLKCIRKNGKNAHLVHWQYGECETNLNRNGYGGGYSNGNGYNNHYNGLPWPGNANMVFDLRQTKDGLSWLGNANMVFDLRKTKDGLSLPGNANMVFDLRQTEDGLSWPGNANMTEDGLPWLGNANMDSTYGRRKTDFRGWVMRIWHSTYGRRKTDFGGRVIIVFDN
nr:hypothetical protein [Tanacetum cinerariifolium]